MTEACSLLAQHGVPVVVHQALKDKKMRPVDRLAMYYLLDLLDLVEFREVKTTALASLMGVRHETVSRSLGHLVSTGYLEEHGKRRPRAYRFFWSRRQTAARAA